MILFQWKVWGETQISHLLEYEHEQFQFQFIRKFHRSNLGPNMPDGYRTSHIQCSQSKQCDKKKI
jgi:hypothetical protein